MRRVLCLLEGPWPKWHATSRPVRARPTWTGCAEEFIRDHGRCRASRGSTDAQHPAHQRGPRGGAWAPRANASWRMAAWRASTAVCSERLYGDSAYTFRIGEVKPE